MYQEFAYLYDTLMKSVDYEKWTDQIEAIFRRYEVKPKAIVDLACGTGEFTNSLAKRGYPVIGVDQSVDMLNVASEKSRESGWQIPYICQDITELELHHPVDAMVCMCDGFNYILDSMELEKCLQGIYRFLNPGGILVFDISSHYKLSSVVGNHTMADPDKKFSLIWLNQFDRKSGILEMNLTFFIRQEGGLYRRVEETQLQRAYRQDEILQLLKSCGFSGMECFAPLSLTTPRKKSQRIVFSAVRRELEAENIRNDSAGSGL